MSDIYARMRAALPIARAVIAYGIDPTDNERINDAFTAVAGDWPSMSDDVSDAIVPYIDDIFVLGMAVGLLLDKSVLERPAGVGRRIARKPRGGRVDTRQRPTSRPRAAKGEPR
jgi:hypothetical protein